MSAWILFDPQVLPISSSSAQSSDASSKLNGTIFEVAAIFWEGNKGCFCQEGNRLVAKKNLVVKEGKVWYLKPEAGCNEKIPS